MAVVVYCGPAGTHTASGASLKSVLQHMMLWSLTLRGKEHQHTACLLLVCAHDLSCVLVSDVCRQDNTDVCRPGNRAMGCQASSAVHTWESVKDVPGRVAAVRITAASQAVGSFAFICLAVVVKLVPKVVRATPWLGQDIWPVQKTSMDLA